MPALVLWPLFVLGTFSLFCLGLLELRMWTTGLPWFAFLRWNLLLAWVPVGLGLLASVTKSRFKLALILAPWLLFFPNAPYLITDLIHLRPRSGVPLWLDVSMLGSFGVLGLLLGVYSLALIERRLLRPAGSIVRTLVVGVICMLGGFGIYLGRFERWNSWDVLTNLGALVRSVLAPLLDPLAHPRALGVTIVMAALLACVYLAVATLGGVRLAAPRVRAGAPRAGL